MSLGSGTVHVPVLLREVVEMLAAHEGGSFVDCTAGGGGHSEAILEAHPENRVIALDRDAQAVDRVRARLARFGDRVEVQHRPFSEIAALQSRGSFTGILADLGLSTDQLHSGRGFSFNDTGEFDMRMDQSGGMSAAELLNQLPPKDLLRVLHRGGLGTEAPLVRDIIVRNRPILSPKQLAELLSSARALRAKKQHIHPATVTFQAIRIAVNDELGEIERLLDAAPKLLASKGRLAVITFHSIEDRLVTGHLRTLAEGDTAPANWRGQRTGAVSRGRLLTKKPVLPSDDEIAANAPSRSARLRVFEVN